MNMKKVVTVVGVSLSFLGAGAFTAHADLISHGSWGYFYSTMTGKTVVAEADPVKSGIKARGVARNSNKTVKGPWVKRYKGSIARVSRTFSGNKTYYALKH